MHISTDPWVWVGVFFTLSVYSFLYKDNPFYKLAEHVTVGVSVGYGIYIWISQAVIGQFWTKFEGGGYLFNWYLPMRWDFIIPALLGIFLIFRLFPKFSWLSRYALALLIGAGAGMGIPYTLQGYILKQINSTMLPMSFSWEGIGNFLIVFGVIATLIYFYFSKEHKGVFGGMASIGIWFLMIGFGATFGYTVMARMSLFIGRLLFLFQEWLGLSLVG